jgi:hypothetical protein
LVNRNDIVVSPCRQTITTKAGEDVASGELNNTLPNQDDNTIPNESCKINEGGGTAESEEKTVEGEEATMEEKGSGSRSQHIEPKDQQKVESEKDAMEKQCTKASVPEPTRNPITLVFAPDIRERNNPDDILVVHGPRERRQGTFTRSLSTVKHLMMADSFYLRDDRLLFERDT